MVIKAAENLLLNKYQVACLYKVTNLKKSPFQVTLQEKWLFCHNKPSEAEQLLGLFQCNLLFPVSILKLKFVSSNQRMYQWTCVWTKQDFFSWLTGSNLLFAVNAYGMGKEGEKSLGLSTRGPH